MFHQLEAFLIAHADSMPLFLFAPLASFAEELIAPIPSGPVMMVMGSLAAIQGYPLAVLPLVAIAAALGKLAGALVIYLVADKLEDAVADRFSRFLGVTHAQIEEFGARFGKGWKDYVLLTALRSLPFVPSALISAGSGAIKIPLRLFVVATLVGSIIRDAFYLYLGFAGLEIAERILERFSAAESLVLGALAIGAPTFLFFLYLRNRRRKR